MCAISLSAILTVEGKKKITFAIWVPAICSKGLRSHVVTFPALPLKVQQTCDNQTCTRIIPPTRLRDVTKEKYSEKLVFYLAPCENMWDLF